MKNRPHAILAECPVCETYEGFPVFIPVETYPYDRSIMDPPLEGWECTSCHTTLRAWALGETIELVPKKEE